jgi:hypothetical protein
MPPISNATSPNTMAKITITNCKEFYPQFQIWEKKLWEAWESTVAELTQVNLRERIYVNWVSSAFR